MVQRWSVTQFSYDMPIALKTLATAVIDDSANIDPQSLLDLSAMQVGHFVWSAR